MITTQAQLRSAFWLQQERPKKLRNGDYPTGTRVAFVEFVDCLARSNQISEKLACKVTLK
jgi:hypothetical protein